MRGGDVEFRRLVADQDNSTEQQNGAGQRPEASSSHVLLEGRVIHLAAGRLNRPWSGPGVLVAPW